AAFTDVPEPSDPAYSAAVAAAIARLVRASEGRALALFTSHAALRRAASALKGELGEAGIQVLAQGIDGTPRQLTERLVEDSRTLVLGTSSFWEGVDIRGDALSRLIRARTDRGVVAVLDRRSYEKSYGQEFVAGLPRCTMVKASAAVVAERAR